MINKVMILGHVGKDYDIHTFENGNKVATLSVATNETYKDKNGEKITNTEWHTVKFLGKLAEIVEKYVKKGDLIFVEGKIKTSLYEKNGEKKYFTEIWASELKMLGKSENKPEQIKTNKNDASKEDATNDLPF